MSKSRFATLALCQVADSASETMRDIAHALRPKGRRAFLAAFADAEDQPALVECLRDLQIVVAESAKTERRLGRLLDDLVAERLHPAGWQAWLRESVARTKEEAGTADPFAALDA